MRCLLVHAHPDPESFSAALRERAVAALERAGHDVDVIDLYGTGYEPCLTEREHVDYHTIGLDHPDPVVADHIERLARAQVLVFVYPTWWSGLPAILEGWLERTLLPGVAFDLAPGDDGRRAVIGNLGQVARLVGITTYGSKRRDVLLLGDAGRRTITRAVRLLCPRRTRTTWLACHQLDTTSAQARRAFLDRVGSTLERLR